MFNLYNVMTNELYIQIVERQFKTIADAAVQYAIDLYPNEKNDAEADKIFDAYDLMRDVTIRYLRSIDPNYSPSKKIGKRVD